MAKLSQYSTSDFFDAAIERISDGTLNWKSVMSILTPHICYSSKYNHDIPYTGGPTDTRCTFLERVEEISTNVSLGARQRELQRQEEERRQQEYANYNNYQEPNMEQDDDSLDDLPAYENAVTNFMGDDYSSQFTKTHHLLFLAVLITLQLKIPMPMKIHQVIKQRMTKRVSPAMIKL